MVAGIEELVGTQEERMRETVREALMDANTENWTRIVAMVAQSNIAELTKWIETCRDMGTENEDEEMDIDDKVRQHSRSVPTRSYCRPPSHHSLWCHHRLGVCHYYYYGSKV